jgi:hypothetical protein
MSCERFFAGAPACPVGDLATSEGASLERASLGLSCAEP